MAFKIKNDQTPTAIRIPVSQEQLVRALAFKAEKFVTAALMDIGASVDVEESRALQLAVLQDFIEVHNEALHLAPVELPEDKEHVDSLLYAAPAPSAHTSRNAVSLM